MPPRASAWLETPSKRYLASYRAALAESGRVADVHDARALADAVASLVPSSTFWLVDGTDYLGTITIRHEPKGRVPEIASHVYYEIRPSMRGRGHGTELLRLGLEKAAEFDLAEVVLAIGEENAASRRVAEANGATMLRRVETTDRKLPTVLYRIAIPNIAKLAA